MAQLRNYTTIEQSKKLAEFLPIKSADQTWERIAIAGANLDVPEELQYRHNGDLPYLYYSGIVIPAWSLAALLDVIKPINENTYTIRGTLDGGALISFDEITNVMFQEEEIIDAVFEMVVWLKEKGKI